jgi:hypothetical protein
VALFLESWTELGWWRVYVIEFISMIVFSLPPAIAVTLFARHRLHAAVVGLLMVIFWVIITLNALLDIPINAPADAVMFIVLWVLPLIILSVAPAKAVARRLIFLALGLLLLIALNELSKLGLDLTAPRAAA